MLPSIEHRLAAELSALTMRLTDSAADAKPRDPQKPQVNRAQPKNGKLATQSALAAAFSKLKS